MIKCTCPHCGNSDLNADIEISFSDNCIYWICSNKKCKKESKISLDINLLNKPLPKVKVFRGR